MAKILMPKATAVWLLENTSLTFNQISDFCELHILEIESMANGEVVSKMPGINPINSKILTIAEIKNQTNGQEKESLVRSNKEQEIVNNTDSIIVSTYQSVSGAGKEAMDELFNQTKDIYANKNIKKNKFTKQIAFNAIPQIDVFSDDGYTKEELKMTNETKKILDDKIDLTATCVRLPVSVSHSESVNIQFWRM